MAKAKTLFKIVVKDDATISFEPGDPNVPLKFDADLKPMKDKKVKKIKRGDFVTIIETNPTWVFIGGRWIRIG